MKKIIYLLFIISLCACTDKAKKEEIVDQEVDQVKDAVVINNDIVLQDTIKTINIFPKRVFRFGENEVWIPDSLKNKQLTNKDLKSLKLQKVLCYNGEGRGTEVVIVEQFYQAETKFIVLRESTEGEVKEYLATSQADTIVDSRMVAYEDVVEYFSITFSELNNDKLTVTTVDFQYDADDTSDTTQVHYRITPELKFEEISK